MNDADRIAAATREERGMVGPLERQRCGKHPTRWITFRWLWPLGEMPEVGDAQIVRGCGACIDG